MERELLIKKLQLLTGVSDITIEFPDKLEHGDYTTNIALKYKTVAPEFKNPHEYARHLVKKLNEDLDIQQYISKIEIAGPGFINFFLTVHQLELNLEEILKKDSSYGHNTKHSSETIVIEFTDPNPFKELHIGHLYSNIVGEALCKLYESQGATVKRVCYQGDVGLHVAKAVWGMQKKLKNISFEDLKKSDLHIQVKFMGEAYADGAAAYEDDEIAKREITKLNVLIFQKDPSIVELYMSGRTWSLSYFDQMYKRIGARFDHFFFESEVAQDGKKLVEDHISDGIFEKSEGAIVFKGEKYGLHTRVFVNSEGLPTYEAKELALAPKKRELFNYDRSIIITANEISEYFKVLLKALSLINPVLASKTQHIGHGFVKLPHGKMSSRKGNVITAESLLNDSKEKAQLLQEKKMPEAVSEMVAQAAIKYAFLKNSIGGDIEYDVDKSVSFQGNSGPYLQYTVVRSLSILKKDLQSNSILSLENLDQDEINLVRLLKRFPEVMEMSFESHNPSSLCTYLYDLAQTFNSYYDRVRIIGSTEQSSRIMCVKATSITLKNGLLILGINVPQEM